VEVSIAPGSLAPPEYAPSPHLTLLGGLLYAVVGEMEGMQSAAFQAAEPEAASAQLIVGLESNADGSLMTVDLPIASMSDDGYAHDLLARRALHLIEASKSLSPELDSSFDVVGA